MERWGNGKAQLHHFNRLRVARADRLPPTGQRPAKIPPAWLQAEQRHPARLAHHDRSHDFVMPSLPVLIERNP